MFIEGTIQIVSEIGIENTRTRDVAKYAGFSEATMYRRFPTKEILLREAFLIIDKRLSDLLTESDFIQKPGDSPFEPGIYRVWQTIYHYLIDHREETIFLIRYRYSSLYTDEVRSMRQAYNGGFDNAYQVFENKYGSVKHSYQGFLVNYIFEMTLCFAEKVISRKLEDCEETEDCIWLAVSSAAKALTRDRKAENG